MKKILLSLFAGVSLLLTGCLETTQEVTLNEDGTGTLKNSSDMSSVLSLAQNMGGAGQLEKMGFSKLDTLISLADKVDSIPGLTEEEKSLLRTGKLNMKLDLEEGQMVMQTSFPFKQAGEIAILNKLTAKLANDMLTERMKDSPMAGAMGGQEMPEPSSFDAYYDISYENGEIKKKLNKEKYASVSSDGYLNGLKQAADFGIPVSATYVFNLPRPAEKLEGKKAKLSDDKMKVTIKAELDDFFENPENLEFKVKY